ncbi:hypothetical protein BDV32DRAFT_139951 [Aspergillus pseudonomiae]|nr:hypothetical protein BDV32DRAFT_139951 [Aspergillus pseudonomiae]
MSFTSHFSENDIFAEFEWLEQIDGLLIDQDTFNSGEKQVGYCDGKLIRCEDIRANFRSAMEEPTQETCFLSFDLLDRYGRLKPEFKYHPVKKGSGVWSAGLDDGDIFLIETLEIDKQYRQLGQVSRLVRAMLERVREKTRSFVAIARPDVLNSEVLCEINGESAVSIKQRNWLTGILRHVLAVLGLSANRLVRLIPTVSLSILDPEVECNLKNALESTDNDYIEVLSHVFDDAARDDPRLTSTDAHGNTVLHLAAAKRNGQGETPLDVLLANLEGSRTTHRFNAFTEDVSDQFVGFSDTAVICLIYLNGGIRVTGVEWQRLKYGCTCGQCVSGFLSPRMRFALECQADIWSDFLLEDIDEGKFWVQSNRTCLTFLPRNVQNNLKTNKNIIPNEQDVEMVLHDASEWPPTSRQFLQRGGSIGAVATMLFQRPMESDEYAGDPLHLETFGDKIQQLPECRNDKEFGFVNDRRLFTALKTD